jgi:hypothetical protein
MAISVFAFTMVFNYKSYGTLLDPSGSLKGFKSIGFTTMGNIGFQENQCLFQYLALSGELDLACAKGTIDKIVHYGARSKLTGE